MSTRDTSGTAPQHSHPHNNTVSRNKKFWVDQVTVPHPAHPRRRTKGGEGQGGGGGYICTRMTNEGKHDLARAMQPCFGFAHFGNPNMLGVM